MKVIRYIFFLLTTIACITFAISNRQAVNVDFFPFGYQVELPLFLIAFVGFVIGVAVGGFSSLVNILKLRRAARSTKKQVNKLEQTLNNLKEKTEEELVK